MNIKRMTWMAAVLLLMIAAPASAWRCAHGYVDAGDTAKTVLRKCGPPDFVFGRNVAGKRAATARGDARWYYDSGSAQLVRVLHFQRGTLTDIDTAGYGPSVTAQACAPADIRIGMSVYALAVRCGRPMRKRSQRTSGAYTEVWTYDFGSQYLLHETVIIEGDVRSVETARRTRRRSGRSD